MARRGFGTGELKTSITQARADNEICLSSRHIGNTCYTNSLSDTQYHQNFAWNVRQSRPYFLAFSFFPNSGQRSKQEVDAAEISNLSIGDTSKLEGEEEENEEPEYSDDPGQDTLDMKDGKLVWAAATMAWLKLICKHPLALSSLTREKGKASSTVIQNLNFENISIEPEHKDNQREQPLECLKTSGISDGRFLTEEEQDTMLKRLESLTKRASRSPEIPGIVR